MRVKLWRSLKRPCYSLKLQNISWVKLWSCSKCKRNFTSVNIGGKSGDDDDDDDDDNDGDDELLLRYDWSTKGV